MLTENALKELKLQKAFLMKQFSHTKEIETSRSILTINLKFDPFMFTTLSHHSDMTYHRHLDVT